MIDITPTYPVKPRMGVIPIGGHKVMSNDPQFSDYTRALYELQQEIYYTVTDMHRLLYLGQQFTVDGLFRCMRLLLGNLQANWLEGRIFKHIAEKKAREQEDHEL